MKMKLLVASVLLFAAGLVAVLASLLLWQTPALAESAGQVVREVAPEVQKWGLLAAALSTTIGALGAGYAVATVGAAGVGALTERPELFGRVLILVGLAEGIAIYGLIVSVLILNRLG